jgi:hypothetical protein
MQRDRSGGPFIFFEPSSTPSDFLPFLFMLDFRFAKADDKFFTSRAASLTQ